MKLGEKQELFAELLPGLIKKALRLGYKVRIGEVQRGEQQAKYNATHCRRCKKAKTDKAHGAGGHKFRSIGILNSLHRQKLAIDIILFFRGKPRWDTGSYRLLGQWWEKQDELCRWGGRFRGRPDGGHFSLTHGGRK